MEPYEINRKIAEKVFGATIVEPTDDFSLTHADLDECNEPAAWTDALKNYSSNRDFAWEVIDKMFEKGWDCEIQLFMRNDVYVGPCYRVVFRQIQRQEVNGMEFSGSVSDAICKAALIALGETI